MPILQNARIRGKQWVLRTGAYFLLGSIPLLRKAAGEGQKQTRLPLGTQWKRANADGVPCEWISPPDPREASVLLYLHGGGGVLGLYNDIRWRAGYIALSCGLACFLPDYRLAPEYPHPCGLTDCVTAYLWLLSTGYRPDRIIVAGESMGGMLTILTLLALRHRREPLPAAAVCISPNTDPKCSGGTMSSNAWKDAILSAKFARTMMKLYVGDYDPDDPLLAPLHADLSGLPPILVQAGADEILLDDSVRFYDCAKAAGTDVTLEVWPHMWHVWHSCVPALPEANQAIDHIAHFVSSRIGDS